MSEIYFRSKFSANSRRHKMRDKETSCTALPLKYRIHNVAYNVAYMLIPGVRKDENYAKRAQPRGQSAGVLYTPTSRVIIYDRKKTRGRKGVEDDSL